MYQRLDGNGEYRDRQHYADFQQQHQPRWRPHQTISGIGILNAAAYPANATVIANDSSTFTAQSVDGGSITAYDTEGNPVNVQFRWAESSAGSWQLFYQSNSRQRAQKPRGRTLARCSRSIRAANSSAHIECDAAKPDSEWRQLGNVQINFGNNGLTQFANSSGTTQVSQLQQNGFAAGQLESVAVDGQNQITGTFSNGQTIPLAQITLATFNGQNSLQALNGGAYAATVDSGPPILRRLGHN